MLMILRSISSPMASLGMVALAPQRAAVEHSFWGAALRLQMASLTSLASRFLTLSQLARVTLTCRPLGMCSAEIFHPFSFASNAETLQQSKPSIQKATTQSSGLPITLTPSTFANSLAAVLVASTTRMEFSRKCFLPTWVRVYQAPALAKPEREPGKEGVAQIPPTQSVQMKYICWRSSLILKKSVETPFGASANLWWSSEIEVTPSISRLNLPSCSFRKPATKPPRQPSMWHPMLCFLASAAISWTGSMMPWGQLGQEAQSAMVLLSMRERMWARSASQFSLRRALRTSTLKYMAPLSRAAWMELGTTDMLGRERLQNLRQAQRDMMRLSEPPEVMTPQAVLLETRLLVMRSTSASILLTSLQVSRCSGLWYMNFAAKSLTSRQCSLVSAQIAPEFFPENIFFSSASNHFRMRASMLEVFMPSSGSFFDLVGSRSFSNSWQSSFSMPSSAFLNLPATTCLTMGRPTTKVEMRFLRASRHGTSSRFRGRKMACRWRRRSSQSRRKAQNRQKAGKSTYSMQVLKVASLLRIAQSRCCRASKMYGRKISIVGIISYQGENQSRGRSAAGELYKWLLQYWMRDEPGREMQLLRERIEENQFSCLKLYPNKALLGKSRVARFSANSEFFEERCALFMEYAYLLLRVEAEQRPAFLSQPLFINHFGEVYLFYSFDPHHHDRLARLLPGGLLAAIIAAFHRVFPPQGDQIADCEHQSIYENTLHSLIPYFDDLKERSEKYYYQSQSQAENSCGYEFRHEPSNPFSVLTKLEGSDLFKEYNFPLKYNTAVLAKGIADPALNNELRLQYLKLWEKQQAMVREAACLDSAEEVMKCVCSYYLQLFRYLQLLQKEAFLKVTVSEIDLASAFESVKGDPACLLTFQSNLKKEPHVNRTSNEKSSESSIRNDKELTKEEKEKLKRAQEYLESLAIFKSKINFTAKVVFRPSWSGFQVELEAVSLWTIDEIYYYHFLDFWGTFLNHWHNVAHQDTCVPQRIATLRLELFHRNKNIGVKTVIRLGKEGNLAEELLVGYDQIVILLLLFEPVLKKMYKMGYQFINFSEKTFEELRQPTFIESKVFKLREALRRYSKYYNELASISSE